MAGIKETKELVKFGLVLGKALAEALADGKVDLTDALKFLPVLRELKDAVEGIDQVPTELKDLDDAEKKELLEYIKGEFDLENDEVEAKCEEALTAATSLVYLAYGLVK